MNNMCIVVDKVVVSDATGAYVPRMSNALGKYLERLFQDRDLTIQDVQRLTRISRTTIYRHINGQTTPSLKDREIYAKSLGFKGLEDFEMGWRSQRVPQQQAAPGETGIPILSECPAGDGDGDPTELGLDNGLGVGYISRAALPMVTDPLAYALIVKGESMAPNYPEGIMVVCSPNAKQESGKVYAIRFGSELDNECTLKRVFIIDKERLLLQPDNPAHQAREVQREHIVRMDRVILKLGAAE